MSDPVIPDMKAEDTAEPSPAVVTQRARVSLAAEAVFVVGNTGCKAREAPRAVELMRYLDDAYAAECKTLDGLIATEALGRPVNVDGSKISLAETAH